MVVKLNSKNDFSKTAVKAGEPKDSYFFQTQFKPLCGSINLAYRIAAHFLMVNDTLNINNRSQGPDRGSLHAISGPGQTTSPSQSKLTGCDNAQYACSIH
jgi:hypothetical protein